MDVTGFEEDLLPATAAEVACYARSAADQLNEMCKRLHLPGLAALFVAAEREAGRALQRLGPVDRPLASPDLGHGPRTKGEAVGFSIELSMELTLMCERVGLVSLATLFYAAWQTADELH